MKKLIIIAGCLVPLLSFAFTTEKYEGLNTFQELCAKERDPLKRQNYCHMLDQYSQALISINEVQKETATV